MLYVCENNLYAASTPATSTLAHRDVAARAAGYDIPGVVVDGNDVTAVYDAAQKAVARARNGEGPSLIECKTYRWRGHTERVGGADPRPQGEIRAWQERDPIERFVAGLMDQGCITQEVWQEMDEEILEEIEDAVQFAKESPFPDLEAAIEDVFAE